MLLCEHSGCQLDPFSAVAGARPQEQGPQMLFHRPRADVQLGRDILIAAALHQQLQDLLIPRCNLDLVQT